ncbi:hypothetical protein BASA62_002855 [Batrachochytrium salamandrivorans]|nr:hypothetical protein BASA62_002855 [Batrachochytrium salamandrivorans]
MAENTPSLADAHIVRTYPNDYAPSDTESEGEAQFEVEVEDEEQHSVSTRFEQNQLYMDRQITTTSGETSAWVLEPQTWKTTEGTDVVLIRKPTASNLSHRLLNPFIYRNIQNSPETSVFVSTQDQKRKIIVGGILARYQYDLRSKTDPHFLNTEGLDLIASEAKTHRTFPPGEMCLVHPMGTTFLKAIVICLLSRRFSLEESMKAVTLDESAPQINETPQKTVVKPKYFDTPERPTRQSARLQTSSRLGIGKEDSVVSSLVMPTDNQSIRRCEWSRKTLLQESKTKLLYKKGRNTKKQTSENNFI